MVAKLTEDEWYHRVIEEGNGEYIPLEPYTNSRTPIRMFHLVCKRGYDVQPQTFLKGNRCRMCKSGSSENMTQKQFEKRISELTDGEYIVDGQYRDTATLVRMYHKNCGNYIKIRPNDFISRGRRCSVCNGGVLKDYNSLIDCIKEYLGNEYKLVTKSDNYVNSKSYIEIKHTVCGKVYTTTRNSITAGHKCTHCQHHSYLKSPEEYKKEFNEAAKGDYILLSDYTKGKEKVVVKSLICGHIFKVRADKFLSGTRCTKCGNSSGEVIINNFLLKHSLSFTREKSLDINGVRHRIDFYLPEYKKIIEFDGIQHFKPIDFFGGEQELINRQNRDKAKNEYFNSIGYKVIRIPYTDIDNIEDILLEELKEDM